MTLEVFNDGRAEPIEAIAAAQDTVTSTTYLLGPIIEDSPRETVPSSEQVREDQSEKELPATRGEQSTQPSAPPSGCLQPEGGHPDPEVPGEREEPVSDGPAHRGQDPSGALPARPETATKSTPPGPCCCARDTAGLPYEHCTRCPQHGATSGTG